MSAHEFDRYVDPRVLARLLVAAQRRFAEADRSRVAVENAARRSTR